MRDKAKKIFNLFCSQNEAAKIKIYDGYFTTDEFIKRLETTKATISYSRYSGGIQTRTIHAVRRGTKILGSEENMLDYFIDPPKNRPVHNSKESSVLKYNPKALDDLFPNSPTREERFVKFCIFQNWQLGLKKYNQKIDVVLKLSVSLETVKKRILERQIKENLSLIHISEPTRPERMG